MSLVKRIGRTLGVAVLGVTAVYSSYQASFNSDVWGSRFVEPEMVAIQLYESKLQDECYKDVFHSLNGIAIGREMMVPNMIVYSEDQLYAQKDKPCYTGAINIHHAATEARSQAQLIAGTGLAGIALVSLLGVGALLRRREEHE